MKRFVLLALIAVATPLAAQNRSADLDKAYDEARAAYNEWQRALARRDQGVESQAGERSASAAGCARRASRGASRASGACRGSSRCLRDGGSLR
jgi:hypothetical protein